MIEQWWECPSCGIQHVSRAARRQQARHACQARAGIDVPLVEVVNNHGLRGVRHVIVERGDYIGGEHARPDGVMAVRTERSDGSNDCVVFAPTAVATLESLGT